MIPFHARLARMTCPSPCARSHTSTAVRAAPWVCLVAPATGEGRCKCIFFPSECCDLGWGQSLSGQTAAQSVERREHENSSTIREHDRGVFVDSGTEVRADTTAWKTVPEWRDRAAGQGLSPSGAQGHDTSHEAAASIRSAFPCRLFKRVAWFWPEWSSAIWKYGLATDREGTWHRSGTFFPSLHLIMH